MSFRKYAAPLRLELRRSRGFAALSAFAVGGALTLPLLVPAPGWFAAIALGSVVVVVGFGYRSVFGGGRIVRAVWNELGIWRLEFADGSEEEEAVLESDSFVAPELVILNFRASGRAVHLVLLRDSLDPETFRRLRVRLRLEGARKEEAAGP